MDVRLCTLISLFIGMIVVVTSSDYYVVSTNGNITLCQQNPMTQNCTCLTFNQYTNNQDRYFHSNSVFIFQPGLHHVNTSLSLTNVQNVSFHGEVSTSTDRSVTLSLNPQVSLSWTNCDQIEIQSLNFISVGNCDYRLIFVHVHDVLLSNVSISGSDGCSAIDSQSSTISIINSTFAGIFGEIGAILVLNSSQVIFNGTNTLSNDAAKLGGAIYATNSEVNISGTVNLISNNALLNSENVECENDKMLFVVETPTTTIIPCPVGFTLNSKEDECVCDERLQPLTQDCYIGSQSILRSSNNFWISVDQTSEDGFVLHDGNCPLDYCIDNPINVTLNKPDVQCHEGRKGDLCGTCKENFSLALGSLNCLPCSNDRLVLLIPFALSGIVVVIVLFFLHLTVATGTINGLILYANIVQANYRAFFPRSTNKFLTVFVAWLNFDFGIQTCFYDGLNIYHYSWLEFLFPFYLWVIIIIIIMGSHYSQRVSDSLGHNAVAVLDTILLMSYSKILKATIVPLSSTSLIHLPKDTIERVWLYNANMSYFQDPHHIVLGIFAIFTLLFLFLPYTFLLLCGHWIQAKSHWRVLSWINKLKPFMDAYHAPYRKNKRHWIGIYLLARCGICITFAYNVVSDHDVTVLVIFSVIAGLSIVKGRVYEKCYNDFLESSFILNLYILSVATFYLSNDATDHDEHQHSSQITLSNVSVGIAFVYFIGILAFHVYQRLESVGLFKSNRIFHRSSDKETANDPNIETVTNSSINLRELLLDDESVL